MVQGTLPFVSVGGVPFVLILASTLRVAPVLRKMYRELALFRFAGKEGVDTLQQGKKEVVGRLQRPGQYQPHWVPGRQPRSCERVRRPAGEGGAMFAAANVSMAGHRK